MVTPGAARCDGRVTKQRTMNTERREQLRQQAIEKIDSLLYYSQLARRYIDEGKLGRVVVFLDECSSLAKWGRLLTSDLLFSEENDPPTAPPEKP